ncbi:hypothetical protein [Leptospira stimsonii]|uniref:hypothetical protein n=1 Tax=Leptospira stimsonii TaxID=2202203 RepID=UPI0011C37A27|nr:hypothetical protein [Leptospira stimsonii]
MCTTVITGTGSEENSWEPVKRVLKKHYGQFPENDPNYIFADLINRLRWLHYQASHPLKKELSERAVEAYFRILTFYETIKTDICEELRISTENKEIKLRSYIDCIEREYVDENTNFITTNWDLLLEKRFKNIYHLHGTVENPQSLFLPSESIEEYFRPLNSFLAKMYGSVMNIVVPKTERLIVYGLSLNALDSEVGLVIEDGFTSVTTLSEVVIIDINPEKVMEKINLCFRRLDPKPKIMLRNPDQV